MVSRESVHSVGYTYILRSQPLWSFWVGGLLAIILGSVLLIIAIQSRSWWEMLISVWLFLSAHGLLILGRISHLKYSINSETITCFDGIVPIQIAWRSGAVRKVPLFGVFVGIKAFNLYKILANDGNQIYLIPTLLQVTKSEKEHLLRLLEALIETNEQQSE